MKKTIKNKFIIVDVPLYRKKICFSFNQTDEQYWKSMVQHKLVTGKDINPETKKFILEPCTPDTANAQTIWYNPQSPIFVRFYYYQNGSSSDYDDMAHEMLHVIAVLMSSRGLQFNNGSEEAYAYLQGYLFGQLQKSISRWKK
jgi:hypothetical protein